MYKRTQTKKILIGNLQLGNQNKIVIQSMTNTKTSDIKKTINQINQLYIAGCELVRVAILDDLDSQSLKQIVQLSPIPIIADIHFNFEYAINAINSGVKKIRLNPGNICDEEKIKAICTLAKQKDVAIRIGVNSGSIPNEIVKKYGINENSMILTFEKYLSFFKKNNFENIVVSLKSTDPLLVIKSYELFCKKYNYPIHLGVTEAGIDTDAIIKSCIGLSPLLIQGLGDTIRISITGDPVQEIYVAKKILNVLGIRNDMVDIISCPTCGRLEYDLIKVVKEIKEYTKNINKKITISILGCIVNGIGEGKEADIGLAGNKNYCILFEKGKIIKQIKSIDAINELKKLIDKYAK